jgi:3,4-dihydroxyphenylacetate 2,3-dioxygenase
VKLLVRPCSHTCQRSCCPTRSASRSTTAEESTLHSGLHDLKREVFDALKPDLVIVLDSHWFTTVEFVITAHDRRKGLFTSDELPRGMSSVPYDIVGNPEFAKLVGRIADETPNCWITPIDNEHLPITYATTNFMPFLQGDEAWISVSVCQTAEAIDFATVGQVIAQAVAESDLRVVLIASGALSHTFHHPANVALTTKRRAKSTSIPNRLATPIIASSTRGSRRPRNGRQRVL